MTKINSAVIIDFSDIDNFIHLKLLENYGTKDIRSFKNAQEAFTYLENTDVRTQLILVENNMPIIYGFDFIERFYELGLNFKHDKIVLLSAFFNPDEIEVASEKNINHLLKPLRIEEVLQYF